VSYFYYSSSRRRHTRSKRDWSSDVCSSDLRITPVVCQIKLPFTAVGPLKTFTSFPILPYRHLLLLFILLLTSSYRGIPTNSNEIKKIMIKITLQKTLYTKKDDSSGLRYSYLC